MLRGLVQVSRGGEGLGDAGRGVLTIDRGRSGRAALVAGVAVATVLGFATPAWAHHPVLQGSTTCSDGVHVVHWSIGNSETSEAMTIDTAVATINAQSYPVTGYANPVAANGTTFATT